MKIAAYLLVLVNLSTIPGLKLQNNHFKRHQQWHGSALSRSVIHDHSVIWNTKRSLPVVPFARSAASRDIPSKLARSLTTLTDLFRDRRGLLEFDEECVNFAEAHWNFYQYSLEVYGQFIKDYILKTFGVDVTDRGEMDQWACQIAKVESIDELYEVAGLESMTKEQYRGFYNANMKDFKYEGVMEELALRLDVYEAFKHKGMCPRCSITDVGTYFTVNELTELVDTLVTKYGSRFISILVADYSEPIIVTDPATFAKELHGATSIKDLVNANGVVGMTWYNAKKCTSDIYNLLNQGKEWLEESKVYMNYFIAEDRAGLLDLE